MVPWGWSAIGLLAWATTFVDVVRTQDAALSRQSQTSWLLGLVFLAPLFIALYWLTESRRRRRRPPAAV